MAAAIVTCAAGWQRPPGMLDTAAGRAIVRGMPPHAGLLLTFLVAFLLYMGALIAFCIYATKEENSPGATVVIWIGFLVALIVTVFLSTWIGAGVMAAACLYIADHKNRSRMWTVLGLFLGPLVVVMLLLMPKLEAGDYLSLSFSAGAATGAEAPKDKIPQ